MALLGINALVQDKFHDLWDLVEMKKLTLAGGATFDNVLQDVNAALALLNSDLINMPHYGQMLAYQDNIELEYAVGVVNGFQKSDEFTAPNPYRGKLTGHNLPIQDYDRSVGWTRKALLKARRSQIDVDTRSVVNDARSLWQQKILERFWSNVAEDVGATSGASVPLADGGAADPNYVPVRSPEGKSFLSTHNHYLRLNGLTMANLLTAVEHLTEHGHTAPFEMQIAEADVAAWKTAAGTDWKAPTWAGINYQATNTETANITDVSQYIGFIETAKGLVKVYSTPRVPTAYWSVYKAYGAGDARAPLRMRIDPQVGFGFNIVPGMYANAPIHIGVFECEFGIGIGQDRTNGAVVYNNTTGDYVVPTIS